MAKLTKVVFRKQVGLEPSKDYVLPLLYFSYTLN
jgi:hypothetical protein